MKEGWNLGEKEGKLSRETEEAGPRVKNVQGLCAEQGNRVHSNEEWKRWDEVFGPDLEETGIPIS